MRISNGCRPQRLPLDSEWTLMHPSALISRSSGEGLCLNVDVHLDWPVPLDLFHTYTHPCTEFTTTSVSDPPLVGPSFLMRGKWKKWGCKGMFLGRLVNEKNAGTEGNRRWREKWWAHTLALYVVSGQTDVSLSSLCVGLHYWLSKSFLSLAGCT